MKATITISKDNKISSIQRLREVKKEIKDMLPDLLPELTRVNAIRTMANNGNWNTLAVGNIDIISDVKLELVMCREMPLICAHFWVNGFINHKCSVCHIINYAVWRDGGLDFDIVETGGTLANGSPRYSHGLDVFYSAR